MFIVRLIRKFFSLLRSDLTGHEIGLGFCLGMLLGTIPFSSVWAVIAVLLLMLVFRSSFSAFLLAAILVKALSFAVIPIQFSLGEWALEGPLAGLFSWLVRQPVLALLDLHRYVVAGGILFTMIVSIPCYPILRYLTGKYRKTVQHWTQTSPAYARFTRFPLIRFFTWLFMGKKKGDYQEVLELKRSPVRKGVLVLTGALIVVVWILGMIFGDRVAKKGFEGGLSRATRSDVACRKLNLGLLMGSLNLEDFRVYEKNKDKGIVSAIQVSSDLSMFELLRLHLVFDEIKIQNMDFRVERNEAGRLNIGNARQKEPSKKGGPEKAPGATSLADFWQQKKLARDLVDRFLEYLFSPPDEAEQAARFEEVKEACLKIKDYAALFADYLLEGDQPLVVIDDLWITGLRLRLEDAAEKGAGAAFSNLALHATALSSNPRLYGQDSVIELGNNGLNDPTFYLKFTSNWSNPSPVHRLELRLVDLPTEAVTGHLKPGRDLILKDGTVRCDATATFRSSDMDLESRIGLKGLEITAAKPRKKILGLDGKLFCRGLTEFLKDAPLETVVSVSGAYDDLTVKVDDQGLIESVKTGIMRTGDRLLEEQLETQMAEARALADKELDEAQKRLDEKRGKLEEKMKDKFGDELGEQLADDLEGIFGEKDQKEAGDELMNQTKGFLDGLSKKDEKKKKKKEKGEKE